MRRQVVVGMGVAIALAALIVTAWQAAPRPPLPGQAITWPELIPPGWAPLATGEQLAALRDDSAAGRARWEELQKAWATAPLRQTLDGAQVRISGYVVPLDGGVGAVTELLLVPYFGACIHTPPPPANQIVWVRLREPARDVGSFDVIEVAGLLSVSRQQSAVATSGYAMKDAVLLSRKSSESK